MLSFVISALGFKCLSKPKITMGIQGDINAEVYILPVFRWPSKVFGSRSCEVCYNITQQFLSYYIIVCTKIYMQVFLSITLVCNDEGHSNQNGKWLKTFWMFSVRTQNAMNWMNMMGT